MIIDARRCRFVILKHKTKLQMRTNWISYTTCVMETDRLSYKTEKKQIIKQLAVFEIG